jgi:hypothetical protein
MRHQMRILSTPAVAASLFTGPVAAGTRSRSRPHRAMRSSQAPLPGAPPIRRARTFQDRPRTLEDRMAQLHDRSTVDTPRT